MDEDKYAQIVQERQEEDFIVDDGKLKPYSVLIDRWKKLHLLNLIKNLVNEIIIESVNITIFIIEISSYMFILKESEQSFLYKL